MCGEGHTLGPHPSPWQREGFGLGKAARGQKSARPWLGSMFFF